MDKHIHELGLRLVFVMSKQGTVLYSHIFQLPFDLFSDDANYFTNLLTIKDLLLSRFESKLIQLLAEAENQDALIEIYPTIVCNNDFCIMAMKASAAYSPIFLNVGLLSKYDEFRETILEILKTDVQPQDAKVKDKLDDLFKSIPTPHMFLSYILADAILYVIMLDYENYLASQQPEAPLDQSLSPADYYLLTAKNKGVLPS